MSVAAAPSLRTLLHAILDLIRRSWPLALTCFLALAAVTISLHVSWLDEGRLRLLNLIAFCISAVAQYVILREALRPRLTRSASLGSFARFFLLTIVMWLGTALGLILLIAPGIILLVRWAAAVPALIAEDLTIGDALSHSWSGTGPIFWPVFQLLLVIWGPPIIAVVAAGLFFRAGERFAQSPHLDVLGDLCLVASWYAAVAVYQTMKRRGVEQVFA